MLLIVGTVRLPPEQLQEARPVMQRMVAASRAEDGCEGYCFAEDIGDLGLIHVKEMWRDQAALDLHCGSPHIAVWRASWQELGIGERNLRVYEVAEPRQT